MQITRSESWLLWADGEEKCIKTDIPLIAFVEKSEELVRQWINEKPSINRCQRLGLTLFRFRYAVSLAHAAKIMNIPARQAREYHQQALCGVMSRVDYLIAIHAGKEYEFHIFAVLNELYERFKS